MLRRTFHAVALLVLGLSFATGVAEASPARPIVYSKTNWERERSGETTQEVKGGLFATLGGRTRQLTDVPGDVQPSVAPDGSAIAFVRAGDIYVTNADGSNLRQLTSGPEIDERPLFSPGSRYLVFVRRASREAPGDLYTVAAAGGTSRPLAVGPGEEREATFAPDGKTIAFVRSLPAPGGGFNDDIYVVRSGGAWTVRLTKTPEDEFKPHYYAGGIVFDRRRTASGGPAAIFTMRRDGTRVKPLVDWGKLSVTISGVSPNGRLLLFSSLARGLWARSLVQPSAGFARSRLLVKDEVKGLVFSPDGRRVAGIFTYPGLFYGLVSLSIRTGASKGEGETWEPEAPGSMQTSIGPDIAW